MEIYLCSAQSLAERNNITLETAKMWDKNFKDTFKRYFEWAAEVARIDVNRGFSINARGRSRWCLESNSKGSEDSPERAAVNNRNQSLGADMTKEADLQCYYEFRNTDVKCICAVHDALVFEVPGTATVDWENSEKKNDIWTNLKFNVSDDAQEVADRIVQIMSDVQTQFYKDLGSPVKGKAEAGIGMYWGH